MKTLKSKLLMLTLSLIGVVAMSFALVNKETPEAKTEVKATTAWRYIGTASQPFNDASLWELGTGSGCSSSGPRPCQLNIEAADENELDVLFSSLSSTDVYNMSSKRN